MVATIICPKCGKEAEASGRVYCLCDLDFCEGQRCGADKLFDHYKCPHCNSEGYTPEAEAYRDSHSKQ